MAYYVSHRSLWKPLTAKLVPSLALGLGVTTFMFVFTYVPQAAIMAFTQGPLAAASAALLVLSESSTLFTVLSKSFLLQDALVDTFDGVLVSIMFVILQGRKAGPVAHTRYFQLKEWNKNQRQKHVEENQAAYTR